MYIMPAVTKPAPVTLETRAEAQDRPTPLTSDVKDEATVLHLFLRQDRLWVNRLLAHVSFLVGLDVVITQNAQARISLKLRLQKLLVRARL